MLNFLYSSTIAPLVLIYNCLFTVFSYFFDSYIWGLLCLSVLNSLLFIPLLKTVESIEAHEKKIQKILEPQIKELKKSLRGQELHLAIKELYTTYRYHPIFALRSSLSVFVQLPFILSVYLMLSSFEGIQGVSWWIIPNIGKQDALFYGYNILPFVMTFINLMVVATSKGFSKKDHFQAIFLALLFFVFLYKAPAAMLIFWSMNNLILLIKNIIPKYNFIKIKTPSILLKINNRIKLPHQGFLIFSVLISFVMLTSFYFPAELVISDPEVFSLSLTSISIDVLPYSMAFVWLLAFIWLILPYSLKSFYALIILFMGLVFLGLAFVYTGNYGALNVSVLQYGNLLKNKDLWIYDIVFFVCVGLICIAIINTKLRYYVTSLFWCFSLVFIGYFGYGVYIATENSNNKLSNNLPPYTKELFTFSKSEPNVLILILDQFTGGHIEDMLIENPNLYKDLDGFTWYADTIATGENTTMSLASIYGGPKYNPILLQEEQEISLLELIHKAYATLPTYFFNKGYRTSIADCSFYDAVFMNKHMNKGTLVVPKTGSDFVGFYFANNPSTRIIEDMRFASPGAYISLLSAFRIVPHSFRDFIYDNAEWHGSALNARQQSMWSTLNELAFFSSMPNVSSVDNGSGTLKIIYSTFPHNPWFLEENSLTFADDPYPKTKGQLTKVNGILPEHYFTEKHLLNILIKYFNWMKEAGIYDNTTIILVSDHCEADSRMLYKALGLNEEGKETSWSNDGEYKGRPHALLLVKEANKQGALNISNLFMMNNDVPSLACEAIGGCNNIETLASIIDNNPNRVRTHAKGPWNIQKHPANKFSVDKYYKITGTMFAPENWEEMPN